MSELDGRCGTCARFVRVMEVLDVNGEVRREGECLLNVWPSPLKETGTCSHYVKRGTVHLRPAPPTKTNRTRPATRGAPTARESASSAGP